MIGIDEQEYSLYISGMHRSVLLNVQIIITAIPALAG